MNMIGVQEKNNQIIKNKDRKVEMYISQLTKEATKLGGIIYDLAYTGHTFAVIHDGQNSIVIESNPDNRNHNKVIITPLKDFIFPEKYYKVKGVVAPIPDDMTIYDIINKTKIDKGKYDLIKNNCFDTVKEVLKIVDASKKILNHFEINRPNIPKTVIAGAISLPIVPIKFVFKIFFAKKSKKNIKKNN